MTGADSGNEMADAELLAVAEEAARAAGEILLRYRDSAGGTVATKSSPTDPVTEADLAAEAAIREVIGRRRPLDAVAGEEEGESEGSSGLRWLVDPIDGTVNFIYSIPIWCVSVACEGRAGVIYDPNRDECFAATANGPALLNGEQIAPTRATVLERCLLATGFGYDAEVRRSQAQVVARALGHVRDIRRGGSAALDMAWVAAGRYDAYFERGVQEWDIAAGRIICQAAGLEVRELGPDGVAAKGVMVCAPDLADELEALVS